MAAGIVGLFKAATGPFFLHLRDGFTMKWSGNVDPLYKTGSLFSLYVENGSPQRSIEADGLEIIV